MPSPLDSDTPLSSPSILMLSPPDTQDVFHTPPEDSSLHSSDDHPLNLALDVDASTQGFVHSPGFSDTWDFVDFGKDSELGFSEAQFMHEIGTDLIPENSQTVEGDELREVPERHYDEFVVSDREISDVDESPLKKLKSDSLGDSEREISDLDDSFDEEKLESPCNGVGCEQVNVDAVNEDDDFGREMSISMDKNLGSKENDELLVVEGAKDVNLIEGIQSSDEVIEGSAMSKGDDEDPVLRKLPDSIRCILERGTANESDSEMDEEKNKISVFEVLKFLSESTSVVLDEGESENENDDSGVTLLEAAKVAGITFPRPRWLPEDYESEFFIFDDQNKDQRK